MYTLILTSEERKAIDWIGNRYEHGDDLYGLLQNNSVTWQHDDEDCGWLSDKDVTFNIPENIAWQIKDLLQNCQFECFAESLIAKFSRFLEEIV